MNNQRPTFGVVQSAKTTEPMRPEVGAIWQQISKANKPYFNIKLNISKSKLQELIAAANGEEINFNLIAFPNDRKENGDNRPAFRIYEEIKR